MTDPTYRPTEPWSPVDRSAPAADVPREPEPDIVWVLRVARLIVLFVYVVVAACVVLLALGFVLRLFGASTDADFTRWVYRNVDRIMEPFRGMFPTHALNDRSVIDFSLLFAMIVYGIAAVALHALVSWLARHTVALSRRTDAGRHVPPGRSAR
jgi:uncharacterized protein YggT (Ycf19 family)